MSEPQEKINIGLIAALQKDMEETERDVWHYNEKLSRLKARHQALSDMWARDVEGLTKEQKEELREML